MFGIFKHLPCHTILLSTLNCLKIPQFSYFKLKKNVFMPCELVIFVKIDFLTDTDQLLTSVVFSENRCTTKKMIKFDLFRSAVTLKIRARSHKANPVLIMLQCYIQVNMVLIQPLDHEIACVF